MQYENSLWNFLVQSKLNVILVMHLKIFCRVMSYVLKKWIVIKYNLNIFVKHVSYVITNDKTLKTMNHYKINIIIS